MGRVMGKATYDEIKSQPRLRLNCAVFVSAGEDAPRGDFVV